MKPLALIHPCRNDFYWGRFFQCCECGYRSGLVPVSGRVGPRVREHYETHEKAA